MNAITCRRIAGWLMVAALFPSSIAWADVGFIVSATTLQDAAGTSAPPNSIALLVADTGGAGFATTLPPTAPLSPGSFLSTGNLIIGRWDLNSLNQPGQLLNITTTALGGGLSTGQPLALYWFPNRSSAATVVGYSQFGLYTSTGKVDGGDPWVVPNDSSLVQLNFYTAIRGGSNPTSAGLANLGVLDPVDPSKLLSTIILEVDGTNVILAFNPYPGVLYDIQSTTDPVSGYWSILATNITGSTYTNIGAAVAPRHFYRLHEQ